MLRYLAVLVLLGLALGCAKPVAEVNGQKITKKEYEEALAWRISEHKARGAEFDPKALQQAVLEELVAEKLLLQEAEERGITVSSQEVQEELKRIRDLMGEEAFQRDLRQRGVSIEGFKKRIRKTLVINKLLRQFVPEDSITEEELRKFYKDSPTPFVKPERVEVRFIQTNTQEQAEAILKEMRQRGLSFDQMAEKLKEEKRAVVSDYGWTQPEFFSPEIQEALRTLKKGRYGGPYKAKVGYYLLKVRDRTPKGIKSFEEAREEIKATLLAQRRQTLLSHLVQEKRKKALVKFY